ncbi:cell adhesion molecule DSCAM-like isoform X1 [Bolinopsis microptera]|uniref:cell adhesion molecule DSCAM-like isoform X1 n=1 Tax=Bolinopsis microptera TaxID=2820187 RepID=UPI00307ACC90
MKFRSHLAIFNLLAILVTVVESVSVEIHGENVYSIEYQALQYFLFIEDKEATISCTVQGTDIAPDITFKKEGQPLNTVLPESLYKIERISEGQTHTLYLRIDAMYTGGYTNIVGNWTCEPGQNIPPAHFKTLCTSKPDITFTPELVQGVARMGTTITLSCNCDSLDALSTGREWNWFIDNATPAGSKIHYTGEGSETGYPTNQLVIADLDDLDSAEYRCGCIVGPNIQFTSNEVQMSVMRPPGVPQDIIQEGATMDSLSISWSNSDNMGVVLGYQISYKEAAGSAYREVKTGSEQQYTLEDLDALTDYNIKIAASNNAGSGSYSEIATLTTSQPRESKPFIIKPRRLVYDQDENLYLIDAGVGVDISLICQVNSYPASIVQWGLDGAELATEISNDLPQNYGRSVQTISKFETEYVLIVRASRKENSGLYTCTASNTKGQETLTFKLRVKDEEVIDDGDSQENKDPDAGSASHSSHSYLLYLLSLTITLVPYLRHML